MWCLFSVSDVGAIIVREISIRQWVTDPKFINMGWMVVNIQLFSFCSHLATKNTKKNTKGTKETNKEEDGVFDLYQRFTDLR
jgi:hypothetical protein